MRFHRGPVRLGTRAKPRDELNGDHPAHIAETVQQFVELEGRDRQDMGISEKLASKITAFSGSMLYVWLHVAWFLVWILINVTALVFEPFDEYPFGLLTMVVSLEAIFLSTFVLISQNRQAIQADRRAKVDLQVDLISEREVTKLLDMVSHIRDHLGIHDDDDQELKDMQEATRVEKIVDAMDVAEQNYDPDQAADPESASDVGFETEAGLICRAAPCPVPRLSLFDLDVNGFSIVARTLIIYLALFLILRVAGKREMGQMSAFDLVVILLVSEAVQNAMLDDDTSVTGALIAAVVLVGANYAVSFARERIPFLESVLESSPSVVVRNGRFLRKEMTSEGIDEEDVMLAIRAHGLAEVKQVQMAVLEKDGSISVVPVGDKPQVKRKKTILKKR